MKIFLLILISLMVFPFLGLNGQSIAGNISINVNDGNAEVTAMGGVSRVSVNEGCVDGSGKRKVEQRRVSSFNKIDIDGVFDVKIELRKKQGVEIIGDDNILPHIVTKVSGDTLVITSSKSICPKLSLQVNISQENIEKLDADGSNDINISGVKNKNLALNLNGATDLRASGSTGEFTAKISGAGSLRARNLHAENAVISVVGSGDAEVYASGKLNASIDGAGDISYFGSPKEISRRVTGVGDIEAGDE
ncbi:MAG: head GIN domain-containing protein [Nitrospirota bacterium]